MAVGLLFLKWSGTGKEVFEAVHNVFDYLPVAALVAGVVLVVHGGIGHGDWSLDALASSVPRSAKGIDARFSLFLRNRSSTCHELSVVM